MKIIYEAMDGKQFFNENDCHCYEETLSGRIEVINAAKTIQQFCNRTSCNICPFADREKRCRLMREEPYKWDFE